jgi:hypothetical protein
MRTLKLRGKTSVAVAAIALVALVHLSAPFANADPAVVIKPSGDCFISGVDANGNSDGALGAITSDTMTVENGNKVTLTCKATVTNLSGKGQHFKGFSCGITIPSSGAFVITTDSIKTVSASGVATLKCTFKQP